MSEQPRPRAQALPSELAERLRAQRARVDELRRRL
jgi:predicted kinase